MTIRTEERERSRVLLCRDLPTVSDRKKTFRSIYALSVVFCGGAMLAIFLNASANGTKAARMMESVGSRESAFQQAQSTALAQDPARTQAPPTGRGITKLIDLASAVESTRAVRPWEF